MIAAEHLSKRFGSHEVLTDVSCSFAKGALTAVVGGNGAGKSTLLRLLGGVVKPSAGVVRLGGSQTITSVREAWRLGVRCIHQEGSLIPAWRVEEHFSGAGTWNALAPWIDGKTGVSELNQHERQLLEVARGTEGRLAAILADEPTAGLLSKERKLIMGTLRDAALRGAAVVVVTHDLEMARALSDRIVVLRGGRIADDRQASEFTSQSLRETFGRSAPAVERKPPPVQTVPVISFQFRENGREVSAGLGEIVGLAATLKSGASDALRQAAGLGTRKDISIRLTLPSPIEPGRRAMSYMSRERGTEWDFSGKSVIFNVVAGIWGNLANRGVINGDQERAVADKSRERFNIVTPSLSSPIEALSGGNRQKVVLARLTAGRPYVLLLDEPFSGIDIVTRAAIARELRTLASEGTAIVLFSHEWDDLCASTDKIAVIRDDGEVVVRTSEHMSADKLAEIMTQAGNPDAAGKAANGAH